MPWKMQRSLLVHKTRTAPGVLLPRVGSALSAGRALPEDVLSNQSPAFNIFLSIPSDDRDRT
jgi:hypothetical protein